MATTPLILRGNLKIGADSLTAADVSDAVTKFAIAVDADEVEVPSTLATPKTVRKGARKFTIQLDYLSNDTATTELFSVLFAAASGDDDGILFFQGSFRDGSVSPTNPLWSGNFVVTHAGIGGDAEGLSTDSATFTMTGAPTKATS